MSIVQAQVNLIHANTNLSTASVVRETTVADTFNASLLPVDATGVNVPLGSVITPRNIMLRLVSGDPVDIGFSNYATEGYPQRLQFTDSPILLSLPVEPLLETSTVVAQADTDGSLAGKYFDLEDRTGIVRVWLNIPLKARQTLTLAGNAVADETVVVGATTYTWKASPASANQVKVGATASESIDNLIAAITAGTGAGTLYGTGTTANASATAVAGAGDTMVAIALTAGTAGNSVATTETMTNGSWGAATLAGGTDASTPPATPGGGRLIEVEAAEGDTASTIATAIQAVLDADDEFSASVATATVSITDKNTGVRSTGAVDGNTGWTITAGENGAASETIRLRSDGDSIVMVGVSPY